ncbi:DUF2306 domain-containing protein [Nonomuraea basaltis]|uniref:DUF2306 domain-containing protein n=1 Tax=Nonomuraea basaltis TaxID=2495887 RepID=UPI00110C578B|nr:DUF2306 domain-containing protein [Nonomuraea basaltis]TMR99676.1 DUF2306 domain-containing protein [Nonomuraea basaltis]
MSSVPQPSVSRTRAGDEKRNGHQGRAARPGRRRLGGRIALGVLAAAVVVFLSLFIPRYLSFDPSVGRLSPAEHPLYFPVLMTHVLGATVAMSTCVLQVWPWLRRRHRRVHRYAGRIYVLAGVWPAAAGALVISVIWPFGPVSALSDIVLALLWFSVTTYGFVLARQGWYADHRRWMLRSFTLTISIIFNRILGLPIGMYLASQLDTTFMGNKHFMEQAASAAATWLPWTVAFITVEWWLDREQRRRPEPRLSPADEELSADQAPAIVQET